MNFPPRNREDQYLTVNYLSKNIPEYRHDQEKIPYAYQFLKACMKFLRNPRANKYMVCQVIKDKMPESDQKFMNDWEEYAHYWQDYESFEQEFSQHAMIFFGTHEAGQYIARFIYAPGSSAASVGKQLQAHVAMMDAFITDEEVRRDLYRMAFTRYRDILGINTVRALERGEGKFTYLDEMVAEAERRESTDEHKLMPHPNTYYKNFTDFSVGSVGISPRRPSQGIGWKSSYQRSGNNNSAPGQINAITEDKPQEEKVSQFLKGVFCSYCKKEGHMIDECMRLAFQKGEPFRKYWKCPRCGVVGEHYAVQCPQPYQPRNRRFNTNRDGGGNTIGNNREGERKPAGNSQVVANINEAAAYEDMCGSDIRQEMEEMQLMEQNMVAPIMEDEWEQGDDWIDDGEDWQPEN